jgi:hypothetical protein
MRDHWPPSRRSEQYAAMADPDKERFDQAVGLQVKVGLTGVVLGIPIVVLTATIYPPPWPSWLAIGYAVLMVLAIGAVYVRGRRDR